MKRTLLAYGVAGGILIAGLRVIEYQSLVLQHSVHVYGELVAVVFLGAGLWAGLQLRPRQTPQTDVASPIEPSSAPRFDPPAKPDRFGITARELETLQLISAGMSTREIASALGVSENTVKTHSSRVLVKLNAKRRTHAVSIAKEAGLIP